METPRVVLNKATSPTVDSDTRARKASSSTVNSDQRKYSSSSHHPVGISVGGERRKPSVSNAAYFYASPRRVSTNVAPKFSAEMSDFQGTKLIKAGEVEVQPTYRTEPFEEKRFTPHIVQQVMDAALEEAVEGMDRYEAVKCRALSTSVCEDIKQKVKWLNYDRYKLICVVYFGSVNGQEMRVVSRCLWNHNFDNFASASIRKGDMFAVALVYGVYKE